MGHWLNSFAEYTLYYREHLGVHDLGVYLNIAKKTKHRGQLEISNFGTYHIIVRTNGPFHSPNSQT